MHDSSRQQSSAALYRRLLGFALPYKGIFLLSVVGMITVSAAETSFAALLKPIMDGGFVQRDEAFIALIPWLLMAIALARAIGEFVETYGLTWVGRKIIADLRTGMFDRLLRLSAQFYDNNSSAGLVSRLIYDVEQVAQASTTALRIVIQDSLTSIALLGWMLFLSWRLTLVLLVVTPPVAYLVRQASQRFRSASQRIQDSVGTIAHVTKEAFQGHRVVKSFGGHHYEAHVFDRANRNNRRQTMKKALVSAVSVPLIIFIAGIAVAGVIYLATARAGQESITAGAFVSFLTAMMMLLAPIKRLAKVNEIIQTGVAASKSIFAIIDEPDERDDGRMTLARARGRIEYRHVLFHYPDTERTVLHDVSFIAEPGTTVALVGTSGSGKTTIATLLLRLYRAGDSQILIDDTPINELTLESLRANIAVVTQEIVLFDDTIRRNIAYGAKTVDDQRVEFAARAAHVLDFTAQMPAGLDSPVGEMGLRLSGGQRQRVAIARALYKEAPILVLDEATSALDSTSERLVQQATRRLIRDRTTLMIAHRLSTVEHADLILVFEQGHIVERGTHHDLLRRGGHYTRLYQSQFADRTTAAVALQADA